MLLHLARVDEGQLVDGGVELWTQSLKEREGAEGPEDQGVGVRASKGDDRRDANSIAHEDLVLHRFSAFHAVAEGPLDDGSHTFLLASEIVQLLREVARDVDDLRWV